MSTNTRVSTITVVTNLHRGNFGMTLPALEPLFRRNAKRTYDVFAASPDDGLGDDEKRQLHFYRSLDSTNIN